LSDRVTPVHEGGQSRPIRAEDRAAHDGDTRDRKKFRPTHDVPDLDGPRRRHGEPSAVRGKGSLLETGPAPDREPYEAGLEVPQTDQVASGLKPVPLLVRGGERPVGAEGQSLTGE